MNKNSIIGLLALAAIIISGLFLSGSLTPAGNVVSKINNEDRPAKEFVMTSFTEIIDGKYYPTFSPKEITVNRGDLVRIKITNTKGTHDFKIDELNVYSDTPLNKEVTIEFVADKAGSFEYYCTKPGHRQNGHWGTLKVLE